MAEVDIELARPARLEAAGQRPPRFALLLAALPHLLFALLLSELLPTTLPLFYGFGLALLTLVTLLLAWRQGWPLWSGSWGGFWFLVALVLYSWLGPSGSFSELLLLLPLVVAGWYVFQRRPLFGLLASVPPLLLMTRLFAFELVTGGEWIWSSLFLLLALISSFIVWQGSLRSAVLLIIGFYLVGGAAFTLGSALLPFRWPEMGPRRPPVPTELFNDFLPSTLAAIVITLAFLLFHPLWRLSKEGGRAGRFSHLLLLAGIAVATAGGFWLRRPRPRGVPGYEDLATALIVAGLLLAAVAAFVLVRAVWSKRSGRWSDLLLLLLVTFVPLVVFTLPTPYAPAGVYPANFHLRVTLSYTGVILWALCVLWFIWRSERPGRSHTRKAPADLNDTPDLMSTIEPG